MFKLRRKNVPLSQNGEDPASQYQNMDFLEKANQRNGPSAVELSKTKAPESFESEKNNGSNNIEEIIPWDVCMILPKPEFIHPKRTHVPHTEIIERLLIGGLVTYQYYSGDDDEIIIKIGCPLARLQQYAERSDLFFLLNDKYLEEKIDIKQPIGQDPFITKISPYHFIYDKYDNEKPDMYANAEELNHPFSSMLRMKLIYQIMMSSDDDCSGLNIRHLMRDSAGAADYCDSIVACFPLHDDHQRDKLWRSFKNWTLFPWDLPFDEVRDYLGEMVALLFVFNGHLALWLRALSFLGILVTISWVVEIGYFGSAETAFSAAYATPAFCVFVSFWSQFMIEYWKRKQNQIAMEWGMTDFEEVQHNRPEYIGSVTVKSPIDGTETYWDHPMEMFMKQVYSYLVIGGAMAVVIGCVSLIFYLQYAINSYTSPDEQSSLGSVVTILSAVQIIVLEYFYTGLAISLNNRENHRTDTAYVDALISKMFIFSFVNSYASLFFVAFIKTYVGESCVGGCFSELSYQLTTIFASKVTVAKVSAYITLVVNQKLKDREVAKEYEARRLELEKELAEGKIDKVYIPPVSKAEKEGEFQVYDPLLGVLEDYAKIFLQFGFVTLFVAACPLAPLLAYLSTWVEMKTDAWRLLYMTKRVIPFGAQDIGTWENILQITAILSVCTNGAILCFTMNVLHTPGVTSLWIFICFQYGIFGSMFIFAYFVDDCPMEVDIQLKRQEHLREIIELGDEHNKSKETKVVISHFSADKYKIDSEDFTETKKY